MKKCGACGKPVSEYIHICPNCGADLSGRTEATQSAKSISMQNHARAAKQIALKTNYIILMSIGIAFPLINCLIADWSWGYQGVFEGCFYIGKVDLWVYAFGLFVSIPTIIICQLFRGRGNRDFFIAIAIGFCLFILMGALYLPVCAVLTSFSRTGDIRYALNNSSVQALITRIRLGFGSPLFDNAYARYKILPVLVPSLYGLIWAAIGIESYFLIKKLH